MPSSKVGPYEGGEVGNRVKTNVIDYRPLTAPLMSPRIFSRPASPSSSSSSSNLLPSSSPSARSPKSSSSSSFVKEQVYRSILEQTSNMRQFDFDKFFQNLPNPLKDPNNNNVPIPIPINNGKEEKGRDLIKGKNKTGRMVMLSRPIIASAPSSSRRAETSLELHTKRIGGFQQELLLGKNNNNPSSSPQTPVISKNKKLWHSPPSPRRSMTQQKDVPLFDENDDTIIMSSMDQVTTTCPNKSNLNSSIKKKIFTKRPSTASEGSERKDFTGWVQPQKDIFLRNVTVVHGSVVTFKSFGYENFTNWFGDETILTKEKKNGDFFHRELDVWWGFSNREISLKLFCGNKLIVEAHRGARGKLPAKKFKETIIIPNHLSVESLIVCRTRSGRLIIQEKSL